MSQINRAGVEGRRCGDEQAHDIPYVPMAVPDAPSLIEAAEPDSCGRTRHRSLVRRPTKAVRRGSKRRTRVSNRNAIALQADARHEVAVNKVLSNIAGPACRPSGV